MRQPLNQPALPDPAHWCRKYELLGLHVLLDRDHQRIVRPVNDFAGAITMPDVLGGKVRAYLANISVPLAIMSHPRSDSWTFLTGTHERRYDDIDLYARLFRHYVRIAPRGASIALPSPADAEMHWREWISEPTDELPTMPQVVDATLRCVRTL
jgi:hypothetical protein